MNQGSRPRQWFDGIKSYNEADGKIGVTDDMIEAAQTFPGWSDDYLSWPKTLWKDPSNGVPCWELDKNAYHIQYLATMMQSEGKWIGRQLEVNHKGDIIEGHHRIRAVKYLFERKHILIPAPEPILIHMRGTSGTKTKAVFSGSVSILPQTARVMAALQAAISPESVTSWLEKPLPAFKNKTPTDVIRNGGFHLLSPVIRELEIEKSRNGGDSVPVE